MRFVCDGFVCFLGADSQSVVAIVAGILADCAVVASAAVALISLIN